MAKAAGGRITIKTWLEDKAQVGAEEIVKFGSCVARVGGNDKNAIGMDINGNIFVTLPENFRQMLENMANTLSQFHGKKVEFFRAKDRGAVH